MTQAEGIPGKNAPAQRRPARLARAAPAVARVALGLMIVVMGSNGFLDFLPHPATPFPPRGMAFLGALAQTGYMVQLVSATLVIAGVLLLAGRFVPLALALLAPVIVNIVAFHLFLSPTGAELAALVTALELYLAWVYRGAYRNMLAARAVPAGR